MDVMKRFFNAHEADSPIVKDERKLTNKTTCSKLLFRCWILVNFWYKREGVHPNDVVINIYIVCEIYSLILVSAFIGEVP